ncbi:glutamate--tRNA ligase [Kamptonema cortianum]|nr:glutamate--tRNA ligase [Geitlerinema splendidum]MDK3158593.1 glutamate--tRNA ligase [Kamptonema cortianum]
MSVRVRFAPSPTGLLHVGALRMAVFNSLFARRHGGVNILRIEDTDRTRYNPDSEAEFVTTLKWAGIEFDEGPHVGGPHGPYRQSERKEAGLYTPHIEKLLESGHAYKAFDTPEELEQMREFQRINKMPTGYRGGDWRDASPEKVAQAEAEGKPYVIRLKIPHGTTIVGHDAIRGRLEWEGDTVDDPVLIKADGMPTYHAAAMLDDHMMGITHVFRGEEWISSFPKHIALFNALGWEMPVFVHCPVIVGTDGKKLSKRHGATRVLDYAAQGYLPHSLQNFVALIGWAPGEDREIMTDEELVSTFAIEGIQPSPGKFDIDKLIWMNGNGIRDLSLDELVAEVRKFLDDPYTWEYWTVQEEDDRDSAFVQQTAAALQLLREGLESNEAYIRECLLLEQERVTTLAGFGQACRFFLVDEVDFDEKATAKWFGEPHVRKLYEDVLVAVGAKPSLTVEECEAIVRGWASENNFEKIGPVVHPLRVALTGATVGPGLFELMSTLGTRRMADRLKRALGMLS